MKHLITMFILLFTYFAFSQDDVNNKIRSQQYDQVKSYSIAAFDSNSATVAMTGLQYQAQFFNVEYAPLVWSLISATGDVINVSIDQNGIITYDAIPILANNGKGVITIQSVDQLGQVRTASTLISLADPSSSTTLACNGNLEQNSPTIVSKLVLFAKADEGSMFQDLAKTILAVSTGDPVSVLEDATGSGDITVRTGNTPPTLELNAVNGQNALAFDGSQSLQYDVPSAPANGTPFKFFAVFQIPLGANASTETLMSSTFTSSNNSLNNETWQFSRNGTTDEFGFRADNAFTNVVSSTYPLSSTGDVPFATWNAAADGNWHLIYFEYDGTNAKGFWDGVQVFEVVPSNPLSGQHFKLGENRNGNNFMQMKLAEMLYADSSMTSTEALETQAYFLCKYGLDASLLAYAAPFSTESEFFGTVSQFKYEVLSNGTEIVYDVVNGVYYDPNNVPTPGLGFFIDPALKQIRDNSIIDAVRIGNDIQFTRGDKSTLLVPVE